MSDMSLGFIYENILLTSQNTYLFTKVTVSENIAPFYFIVMVHNLLKGPHTGSYLSLIKSF